MQTTTNYGFKKPSRTEAYDIDIFNENADIIDTKLKEIEESADPERLNEHIGNEDIHFSAEERTKLSNVAEGANNYTHPTYPARSGVPTENQTPAFGGTFNVSQPTSDDMGHITGITSRTVTIPNTAATTSAAGLMSASDKSKLDGIAAGANNYTHPNSGATAGTYRSVTVNAQGHVTAGSNPTLAVNQGGTGATTAAAARTNLGLAYGTAAGTVCQGNDSRLSNARTPTAHNQAASTITAGTFAGRVVAPADTAYTTAHITNSIATTTDPGAGASVSYPNGTTIDVYE